MTSLIVFFFFDYWKFLNTPQKICKKIHVSENVYMYICKCIMVMAVENMAA